MIVECRTYNVAMGKLREYLALYEEAAAPVQNRVLGRMIGAFTTEVGPLSQVRHLWAYRDLADYEARRALLKEEADQRAYSAKGQLLVSDAKVELWRPTGYCPLK